MGKHDAFRLIEEATAARITDKDFRYVPSNRTDLRETFARVRRELEEKKARERMNEQEARSKTIAWRKR